MESTISVARAVCEVSSAIKMLVLAAGLLTQAACKVGPNYNSPELPPDALAPLTSVTAAEVPAAPPDDWWRLYLDQQLDALIREALLANDDLAAAQANLLAAAAVVDAARAGRYPDTKLGVGGVYGRDIATDEILELTGRRPLNVWLLEDLFQMSYEVDLFGQIGRSIETARANAAASMAALDSAKITVAAETARAYAQVCTFGERLIVARHSLAIVQHEYDITERRRSAGGASEFDVVRAEGQIAQARSKIPPLEGQRRAALFELTALLGRTPANAPFEVEKCMSAPQLVSLLPVGDGASLLKRRPDVRQAESRVAAATANIGVVTADLYPKITLVGFYGGAATTSSELTSNVGLTWGVGPSISWDFPNILRTRSRIAQARAGAVATLAQFDGTVIKALKETEQALAAYGSALDQRQALLDAQRAAHRGFEIAQNEFLSGGASNLDLLTAEDTLTYADAAVAESDSALVQDQIAVFKSLGGGWRVAPEARIPKSP